MALQILQEISRKTIHVMILFVLVIFYAVRNTVGEQAAFMFLAALLAFFLIIEYLRLDLNIKLPFFHQFIRPKEEYRVYGAIFFLSSTIISLAIFSTPVALAALLMTAFGDMAAAIVGKRYGATLLFRSKTLIGFVAGLITNLLIAVAISLSFSINLYILIVMAFAATITETITDEMDDNLMVPILTGFIGQVLLLAI